MKTVEKNDEGPRSEAAYPAYDLEEALKVAEAVRDLGGGNVPVPRSQIAKHLKYALAGPSFFQRVAAARSFGAIDGRGSYSLTKVGKQYFFPTTEDGKHFAALSMLRLPKAFSILVQKFDGLKLPSIDVIGNIIHDSAGIPISKKNALAGCFIRSAQFIGAIGKDGVLNCSVLINFSGGGELIEVKSPEQIKHPEAKVSKEFGDQEEHSLFLDKEKTRKFTINSPLSLTQAEYMRICEWIKVSLIVEGEKT